MAEAARSVGARLVHCSTDNVFDGTRGMYREGDATGPVNFYGLTKLRAEQAVLAACPNAVIARVAIVMEKAMERYLPEDILYRPKMGFVTPISQWFRGKLAQEARALAGASSLAQTGWVDMKQVDRIVAQHQSGKADHGRLIWQLLMLDKAVSKVFRV